MDRIESQSERTSYWDTVSFVISSRYRVFVLDQFTNGPKIPSRITTDDRVLITFLSVVRFTDSIVGEMEGVARDDRGR